MEYLMGADAAPSPAARLLQLLLLVAALDSLGAGAWAALDPDALFRQLQVPPTRDSRLFCRVLGALTFTHAPCLVLGALRPRQWGGLVVVPLIGRALLAGVWLWLLHSDRVRPSPEVLRWLLIHDAGWLPFFVVFLAGARRPATRA
jgi:hypothetical protein